MLVPILTEQGRTDEAVGRIEARWERLNEKGEGAIEPAIQLLWQHIELTSTATPIETLRASIDQAGRLAPEDDRVWLGRANVAIRTGSHDEAGRWLDACRRRRPEDVPVWRARLELGLATHRIEDVEEAITHLPDAYWTPARRHQLSAWLASARGDEEAERRELGRLLTLDPANLAAIDRLADLAEKDRQTARVAELRRTRGEVDALRARYGKLHHRKQPLRDAIEMAGLAEKLGRRFEARAFLTLAISEDPGRQDLRAGLRRLGGSTANDASGMATTL
jgi:tetratricopeptide (TPR) repeat protein